MAKKYTLKDIDTYEKFKQWFNDVFGGPLVFLYGYPLKSDRKTPMDKDVFGNPVSYRIAFERRKPTTCPPSKNYIEYQKNLLRIANGLPTRFLTEEDFNSGRFSKYWKFFYSSDDLKILTWSDPRLWYGC